MKLLHKGIKKSSMLLLTLIIAYNLNAQSCGSLRSLAPKPTEDYKSLLVKSYQSLQGRSIKIQRVLYASKLYKIGVYTKNDQDKYHIRLLNFDTKEVFWGTEENKSNDSEISISFGNTQKIIIEIYRKDKSEDYVSPCVGLYVWQYTVQEPEVSIEVKNPPTPVW